MSRAVTVTRVRRLTRETTADAVAIEEPLEIRLHGQPFSVIMRTPGADRELAAGFLLSERVIRGADDLGTIEYCLDAAAQTTGLSADVTAGSASNVIDVRLSDPSRADAFIAGRRQVTTSSSCGLCGRRTIESLATDARPVGADWTIGPALLTPLPDRLRAAQTVFDETGGLHAAGLFTPAGELSDAAEDVGRHNAVDKVIGRSVMRDALPLSDRVLVVSGRASFEIVQKALFGGIPIVASVSAPSSLAIELAETMNITLAGFVRGDTFNIYTHAWRIRPEA